MGNENNILIIGPSDSGKDTVANNIEWDKSRIKIASYASIVLNNKKNFLFMLKGEENYNSFEEIILSFKNGRDPDGIIVVIDNSLGFKENDREVIEMITSREIPHVIFANKQDMGNNILNNHFEDSLIIPTIATEGIGITDGVKLLHKSIQPTENITVKPENSDKTEFTSKLSSRSFNDNEMVAKMKDALKPSDNHDICRLKMSMHPVELDNVMEVLQNNGFSNITVIKTNLVEDVNTKEIYRGFSYNTKLKMKVELVMIIKSEDVQYVISAIESIKTEDIDDFISIKSIDDVLRVRTLEKGEDALY